MLVKTESGDTFNAAGAGTKGIAIAGLATGAASLLGGGLLNGLIGGSPMPRNCGNGCSHGHDRYVTQKEMEYAQAFDALSTQLEREKAERYTDSAVIAQANKEAANMKELYTAFVDTGIGITKIDEQVKCLNEKLILKDQILNMKIQSVEDKLTSAIALESERRVAGDQNLYCYVNATFVPGKLVMPKDSICPSVMPEFNSWTAPTTTTTGA
jgi:hypothetical protein